jgi:hypothetical protein
MRRNVYIMFLFLRMQYNRNFAAESIYEKIEGYHKNLVASLHNRKEEQSLYALLPVCVK